MAQDDSDSGSYLDWMMENENGEMASESKQDSATNGRIMESHECHFEKILNHKGPLSKHKDKEKWRGCKHNVYVLWANGDKTWEPVKEFVKKSPQEVANYIVENNLEDELMNEDWWKRKSVAEEVARLKRSPFGKKKMCW